MKDKIIYLSQCKKSSKLLRGLVSIMARDNPFVCFVNPRLMFSHLFAEEYMNNALTLLDMCDEMWVIGDFDNCEKYEIEYCREHKIPVKVVRR